MHAIVPVQIASYLLNENVKRLLTSSYVNLMSKWLLFLMTKCKPLISLLFVYVKAKRSPLSYNLAQFHESQLNEAEDDVVTERKAPEQPAISAFGLQEEPVAETVKNKKRHLNLKLNLLQQNKLKVPVSLLLLQNSSLTYLVVNQSLR